MGVALGPLILTSLSHADSIFVANCGNNTVTEFNSAGGEATYVSSGLDKPIGLAFNAVGNLFISDFGNNTIEEVSATGGESLFASSGLHKPKGLAFDIRGNLYVANFGNNTIEKFNSSGHGTVFARAGLHNPDSIALDPINGDLFVGNNNGTIEMYNSSGHGRRFASGLGEAVGLAFDIRGDLYVADYARRTIDEFTPRGHKSVYARLGAGDNPLGLTFDNGGDLYVSLAKGTIEEFKPNGGSSVLANNLRAPCFFATQVPEPSSLALAVLGTVVFLGRTRLGRPVKREPSLGSEPISGGLAGSC
jgi:DNA-binding beta-propeller fold protein YncE